MAGLFLTDASPEEIDTVYGFCEKVGLPTTLAHIGLKNPEQNKMRKAAEKACASTEGIHHEAVVISPEKVLNAMLMADSYGQSRGL